MAAVRHIKGPKKPALRSQEELAKISASSLSSSGRRSGNKPPPRDTLRTAILVLRDNLRLAPGSTESVAYIVQQLNAALEKPDV